MPNKPLAGQKRRLGSQKSSENSAPPTKSSRAPVAPSPGGRKPQRSPLAPKDTNSRVGLDDVSCSFGKPVAPIDHDDSFQRLAKWSVAVYRSYAKEESELARTRSDIYADPKHSVKGLDGDARFARIKDCLKGFENRPIELQRLMHFSAFQVEGPLIWGEAYASLA